MQILTTQTWHIGGLTAQKWHVGGLKEGGHYFPQREHRVPSAPFFVSTYIKNYGRYSCVVKCCQVAFLMLYMIPEQLGRCNLNWAEEGRNVEHHDRKMLKISLFWSSQTDFGLLSIGRNVSLNDKKQFFVSF